MTRPDCVRAGDDEVERLLRRAFRAGFYESREGCNGENGTPDDDRLSELFDDWRSCLVTRKAPSLSLSQIETLYEVCRQAVDYPWKPGALLEMGKTLRALRAELSKEDDGGR
ncbi:MAG TPA: hypothetical protein VFF79_13000 [Conexibacter sp.]|jgi:hypothetical protein|nr:hypothetical protein [Conexibacter sp.]